MKNSLNRIMLATAMMAGLGFPVGFGSPFANDQDFGGDPRPKSKRHQDQENTVKLSKKQKAKRRKK